MYMRMYPDSSGSRLENRRLTSIAHVRYTSGAAVLPLPQHPRMTLTMAGFVLHAIENLNKASAFGPQRRRCFVALDGSSKLAQVYVSLSKQ
jgi:hypothetical protein